MAIRGILVYDTENVFLLFSRYHILKLKFQDSIKWNEKFCRLNKCLIFDSGCLYRSLLCIICANLQQVNSVFHYVENILKSVKKSVDIANKMLETLPISVILRVDVDTNMTRIDFRKIIEVAQVPELFEDFSREFSKLLNAGIPDRFSPLAISHKFPN